MAKMIRLFSRKRPLEAQTNNNRGGGAELDKCLTTTDLISLGVGSCCGAGMYLTAGIIASKKAGPGGVFSLCAAGLASILTGFHYAELAGICPYTSGSSYMYAYVTVGELAAFIIGWGLIVEYVIGTAAAAVALSETFHSVTNNHISHAINSGMDSAAMLCSVSMFGSGNVCRVSMKILFIICCLTVITNITRLPHVDFLAAIVCLLLMWLLASGVQMSARVNNILNALNFVAWAVFCGAAYSLGSRKNWTDNGGFFPFGYKGVFSAIPTAYYAFVGFDGLATTGAECKNPVKSIPISVISSIVINIVIFTNVVIGLTFNVPYNLLPSDTAMLDMFAMIGYPALKYIVAVGAVSGLFAATFGSLFPLPRVLQAMAQDGLFFRYFAHVCPKRQTALRATILSGLVATCLAAFVELTLLIELVLIGTLLAYVIVTFVTLILRLVDIDHVTVSKNITKELDDNLQATSSFGIKRKNSDTDLDHPKTTVTRSTSRQSSRTDSVTSENGGAINVGYDDDERHLYPRKNSSSSNYHSKFDEKAESASQISQDYQENSYLFTQTVSILDTPMPSSPIPGNTLTKKRPCSHFTDLVFYLKHHVIIFLLLFYGFMSVMCAILAHFYDQLAERNVLVIIVLAASMTVVTCMAVLLMFIPHSKRSNEGFRTPLVPLLTVITAGINIYLMTSLKWVTWLLFLGWLLIGLVIYFVYGTKHSNLNALGVVDSSCDQESAELEMLTSSHETSKECIPLLQSE